MLLFSTFKPIYLYIIYLIEEYANAAENCERILKDNAKLWEKWVFTFANLKHLQVIKMI